jgi:hypothetical protein
MPTSSVMTDIELLVMNPGTSYDSGGGEKV